MSRPGRAAIRHLLRLVLQSRPRRAELRRRMHAALVRSLGEREEGAGVMARLRRMRAAFRRLWR